MEIESLTFTARPGVASSTRYIEVWLGDQFISQHLDADEARESAIGHLLTQPTGEYSYEFRYPNTFMEARVSGDQVEVFDVTTRVTI